jgi:hypothetical protein
MSSMVAEPDKSAFPERFASLRKRIATMTGLEVLLSGTAAAICGISLHGCRSVRPIPVMNPRVSELEAVAPVCYH